MSSSMPDFKALSLPRITPLRAAGAMALLLMGGCTLSLPEKGEPVVVVDLQKSQSPSSEISEPQCSVVTASAQDVFRTRMNLFEQSDQAPQWLEDHQRAIEDIAQYYPELFEKAGFTNMDHASQSSLATINIESVWNTKPGNSKNPSVKGPHHFKTSTFKQAFSKYPDLKRIPDIANVRIGSAHRLSAYYSTIAYIAHVAHNRQLYEYEVPRYANKLERNGKIKPSEKADLIDNAEMMFHPYRAHVLGARGFARLAILDRMTKVYGYPERKTRAVVGRAVSGDNPSLVSNASGIDYTAGGTLWVIRQRLDNSPIHEQRRVPDNVQVTNALSSNKNGCQSLRVV